jgi:hypothetical protein
MFVSLNFLWPPELKALYNAMSVFNFNIQLVAPEVWHRVVSRRTVCVARPCLVDAASRVGCIRQQCLRSSRC